MPNQHVVVYDCTVMLRDCSPVRVRVTNPDDDHRLVIAFGKLERESIYRRYFSFKKQLTPADLERGNNADGRRGAAIMVTLAADEETVIAVGLYSAHPAPYGAASAELAFVTEEDYQGQGIARLLLKALAGVARVHGIVRLDADVLAQNL